MRVLVAGDWHSDLHEEEVCKSLRRLGHEVLEFKWHHYFAFASQSPRTLVAICKRIQNKFVLGPLIARLNKDFLDYVLNSKPQAIFIYRGTHLTEKSLRAVRLALPSCKLIGYNNDNPFAPMQPKYFWRHFISSIPQYDLMLAYRHENLKDFTGAGARKVDLLRSWYLNDKHTNYVLTPQEQLEFSSDVVFVGHFEDDGRLECLEEVAKAGVDLRIFGPPYEWNKRLKKSKELRHLCPVRLVWREEYVKAIAGAKIALCFLSKLNQDTYTRRCFEIPAIGTLLLSESSEDLQGLYRKGIDADFFKTKDELMLAIRKYLGDDDLRAKVALSGQQRVIADRHDIDSRMSLLIDSIESLNCVEIK